MGRRVLLGMSGGIDSSVSAMILQNQHYEVVGITFLFAGSNKTNQQIIKDAKNVAEKLGIKHITIDLRKEFRATVIKYFKEEYLAGRTPFPCAYCNPKIKFNYLQQFARKENCDFISTGHYAQTRKYNDNKYIYKGVDSEKDQSFFLWGLNSELIKKSIFPLGGLKKNAVRQFANRKGFKTLSMQKESFGICFIEGKDYRKFLETEGIFSKPGNFVDTQGNILGRHEGITNYTIGQRRGLGVNHNFPVFVSEFRLDDNEIVLAKYNDLYKKIMVIKNYQIVDLQYTNTSKRYIMKVRYRLQETPCELNILDKTRAQVRLLKPEAMIAEGQTAVFYDQDRLVGGGFIESSK